MILHFPNLDTLRLALTSGVVPADVSLAPARAAVDQEGHVWIEPGAALSRTVQSELRKLGVQSVKENGVQLEEIHCWPQLLPLKREALSNLSSQTPVLFELADPEQLPEFVGEMLRLGNDRQSFRYLEAGAQHRVLLRVVGPPYYTLLRALERDSEHGPRAYLERAPRVWVEIGQAHPLVEQLQVPAGKLLMMRPARQWTFLDDAPFRDIYEILDFNLPGSPVHWREAELDRRLKVPLRLAPGSSTAGAELWVLRERAIEQLDALVGAEDDRLLARLAFAVVPRKDGRGPMVVLRVRPSKLAPPVLVLDAVGFRSYQKMPNLFVPCGSRLRPQLRRDAVRKLLADDPARITWLFPLEEGRFVPESVADQAFQPLEHWIDYILDRDHGALEAWLGATRFDFESFIVADDSGSKRPPRQKPPRGEPGDKRGKDTPESSSPDLSFEEPREAKKKKPELEALELPQAKPSELEQRLHKLEDTFKDLKTPLDAPERQDLWRELALVNAALNRATEASVCWSNALWELDEAPAAWAARWFESEAMDLAGRVPDEMPRTSRPPVTYTPGSSSDAAALVDWVLANPTPLGVHVRLLAAAVIWAATRKSAPREISQRLDRIQTYLEAHDELLSVRIAWLAWVAITRLAHGDVLGLARARDRLLERLYRTGLSSDLDLPGFVRYTGQRGGERFHAVRDRLVNLRHLAHKWIKTGPQLDPKGKNRTSAYVDLMFAFGMARLGEHSEADRLVNSAKPELDENDVHSFLLQAFKYRIDQARAGKGHGGPLPPDTLEYLEGILPAKALDRGDGRLQRYTIDKLRQRSRILEPHEKLDSYRYWHGHHVDELTRDVADLPDILNRDDLAKRVRSLVTKYCPKPEAEMPGAVALAVLQAAPRLGEETAQELLQKVAPILEHLPARLGKTTLPDKRFRMLEESAWLFERALFLAAHYDFTDMLNSVVEQFQRLLGSLTKDDLSGYADIDATIGQCLRGLRKFGLRDAILRLLQTMSRVLLGDEDLNALAKQIFHAWRDGRAAGAEKPALALRSLLHVATGWFYFGREPDALAVLDAARRVLLEGKLTHEIQTHLACSYVGALSQASSEEALRRVEELFRELSGIHDPYTTNDYYSISRLKFIDAVVLAIVSDDFTVGSALRRWLDEDEYLVRRRIHRDMKAALLSAGA
jgi:hypothetical protein